MSEKTVALAGLGALGGTAAMEFARAQTGELRIFDHDYVEAGTIVRWPFGVHAVGHLKAQVLRDHIALDYPFTTVHPFTHLIGGVPAPEEEAGANNESNLLTEFLRDADILVDATAENGVSYLLSALATEAGIPQVYVWATEGGWGGGVARVIPGKTGCWYCLQLRIEDGSIEPPPLAETGTVQPRGCAAPTWTGTSFDALPLVAQAMRTACFTLLAGRRAEDPLDVFICAQKAESPDDLAAPIWTSYALEPHDRCPHCAAAAAA
jgi:molybdopterin/thiamine biosynthesis adenylyltransferase